MKFRSFTGKLIRAIFWVFLFIILAAYAASFAAQRIADSGEHVTADIDSVEDLVRASDEIHYGVIGGGTTQQYFLVSRSKSLHNNLYQSW